MSNAILIEKLESILNTSAIVHIPSISFTDNDTNDTNDVNDSFIDEDLCIQDRLLVDAIALQKVKLSDSLYSKILDRTIVDSFLSDYLEDHIITITGKKIDRSFSDNNYGILGQLSARSIITNEIIDLGVLLQDNVLFYDNTQNYLYLQFSKSIVKRIKNEIERIWCIDTKYTKDLVKQAKIDEVSNKAKSKLEAFKQASTMPRHNRKLF